jgi:hypothetical protein
MYQSRDLNKDIDINENVKQFIIFKRKSELLIRAGI